MVLKQLLQDENLTIDGSIGTCLYSRGRSYCGRHTKNGRNIVIRVASIDSISDEDFEELKRETRLLCLLNNELILKPSGSFVRQSMYGSFSALMDLGSVDRILEKYYSTGFPEKAIASILYQMTYALRYVHEQRIVHRAVKASHILCSTSGRIKLSGFRHAIYIREGRGNRWFENDEKIYALDPQLHDLTYWAAPEVLAQNLYGYSYESDIYSLGATLCEMANGFVPFTDIDRLQMVHAKLNGTEPLLVDSTNVPPPEAENPDAPDLTVYRAKKFSDKFHKLLPQLLHIDPEKRISLRAIKYCDFIKEQLKPEFFWQSKPKIPTFDTILPNARSVSPYPVDFPALVESEEEKSLNCERCDERYLNFTWNFDSSRHSRESECEPDPSEPVQKRAKSDDEMPENSPDLKPEVNPVVPEDQPTSSKHVGHIIM